MMSDVSMVNGHDDDVMQGDLISRSALLDELRKGTIITTDIYGTGIMAGLSFAMRKVEEAPAVDAVHVVRCKDCVGFNADDRFCVAWAGFVRENDFCSYGKRRDGE